jgi:hypothetical protein
MVTRAPWDPFPMPRARHGTPHTHPMGPHPTRATWQVLVHPWIHLASGGDEASLAAAQQELKRLVAHRRFKRAIKHTIFARQLEVNMLLGSQAGGPASAPSAAGNNGSPSASRSSSPDLLRPSPELVRARLSERRASSRKSLQLPTHASAALLATSAEGAAPVRMPSPRKSSIEPVGGD